jgi:hypothetical protein
MFVVVYVIMLFRVLYAVFFRVFYAYVCVRMCSCIVCGRMYDVCVCVCVRVLYAGTCMLID